MSTLVQEHPNAPDHCTIKAGISFFSRCKHQNCSIFRQYVVINLGYITGDLGRLSQSLVCPVCGTLADEFFKIGIACCEVLINGKDNDGRKVRMFESIPNFKDINFMLGNYRFVAIESWVHSSPPLFSILWVNSLTSDKYFKFGSETEITLLDYAENFETTLNVPIANQAYYFKGKQVYRLNPSLTSVENPLSVVNIETRNPKLLTFLIGNQKKIAVANSENQKTLYDALFELSLYYNLRYYFLSNLCLMGSSGFRYSLNSLIIDVPDTEIISLGWFDLLEKFNLTVLYKDVECKDFVFDPNTEISELHKILSLWLSIPIEKLYISSTFAVLEEGTLNSNNIDFITVYEEEYGGNRALPNLADNNEIYFNRNNEDALIHRIVQEGLNWVSTCRNQNCPAYNQIVISNSGYGVVEYNENIIGVQCPTCSRNVHPESFGFYMCRQIFLGKTLDRQIIRGQPTIYEGNQFYFFRRDRNDWLRFKIQVDKLY